MLSLGRNPGEYVVIGDNIVVQVISVDNGLRLAFDVPKEMSIVRGEIYEKNNPAPQCLTGKSVRRNPRKTAVK